MMSGRGREGVLFDRYLKVLGSNYGLFAVNIAVYVVSVPLLVSWLGPESFGVWLILLQLLHGIFLVTTSVAVPVAREATSCYVGGDRHRLRTLFQTVSVYYLAVGAVLLIFALLVAAFAPQFRSGAPLGERGTRLALILLSVHLIITTQLNLLLGILTGFQLMHVTNVLRAALTILGAGAGIVAAAVGLGVLGLALGQVVAGIVVYGVCGVATRRMGIAPFGIVHFDVHSLRGLLRSGSNYLGYSVSYLLLQSDIILVGFLLGPTVAAIYGIAYKALDYLTQLIWRIPDSLFPLIAELDAREDFDELKQLHRLGGMTAMALTVPAAIMLALYGHSGMLWWLGPHGTAGQSVFRLFGLVLLLQVLVHSSLIIPFATNRMSKITRVALVEGCIKVLTSLFLLSNLGVGGVVVATILAQVCLTGWYVPSVACRITMDRMRSYLWRISAPTFRAACVGLFVGVLGLYLFKETSARLLVGAPLCFAAYVLVYVRQGVNGRDLQRVTTKVWTVLRGGVGAEQTG